FSRYESSAAHARALGHIGGREATRLLWKSATAPVRTDQVRERIAAPSEKAPRVWVVKVAAAPAVAALARLTGIGRLPQTVFAYYRRGDSAVKRALGRLSKEKRSKPKGFDAAAGRIGQTLHDE